MCFLAVHLHSIIYSTIWRRTVYYIYQVKSISLLSTIPLFHELTKTWIFLLLGIVGPRLAQKMVFLLIRGVLSMSNSNHRTAIEFDNSIEVQYKYFIFRLLFMFCIFSAIG